MTRLITFTAAFLLFCVSPAFSQVNKSKEFPNVFHSPAADSTPSWVRSVLQMEVVVKKGESDAQGHRGQTSLFAFQRDTHVDCSRKSVKTINEG